MADPAVLVALITAASLVTVEFIRRGVKRAEKQTEQQIAQQVKTTSETATQAADESARQVGVDVGGVVSAAITAAVQPVSERLAIVEGEVRILRSDLVPVAVADRDLVLGMVADGLVHHGHVVVIPESVAPLYPPHLRHIPRPPKEAS